MDKATQHKLTTMFTEWSGQKPEVFDTLPKHGSDREYVRLSANNISAIGAYNPVERENNAFLAFSKHFKKLNLPVPEIYRSDIKNHIYLQEDLGDTTLFSRIVETRKGSALPVEIVKLYKEVLTTLARFQTEGGKDIDYKLSFPRHVFDRRSMMWDLNYFKYYFLKLANIPFDEQDLETDFKKFADFLLQAPKSFFLYRDFQSRNIMLKNDKPYFIDYQGGRKGALQYDVASLLYDAKADIPREIRGELLEHYLDSLEQYYSVDRMKFKKFYTGYVLIRIMQAMGAYGFRGFYQQKTHFLQSVPYAIQNLEWLLSHKSLPVKLPALMGALHKIVQSTYLRSYGTPSLTLTMHLSSFSYKKGLPRDHTGHGGGFIFDSRSLTNPFRVEKLRPLTGNDKEIIDYLDKQQDVQEYLSHAQSLIINAINNYKSRNFTDISVAFGCTGGKHRSVYCANKIAESLKNEHDVIIELTHRDVPITPKI